MSNYYGLRFDQTCGACPEQYDVYDDDRLVGYARLRHGHLRGEYLDSDGVWKPIYQWTFSEPHKGLFTSQEEREVHLADIALQIQTKLTG